MAGTVLNEYDITIHENGTYDKFFQWKVNDVVVSLEGVTGYMRIKKKLKDDLPILDLPFVAVPWIADGDSGIYMEDVGVDDRFRIYVNNEDSKGICATHKNITGTYNLFLENASGECILKQYGTANLIVAV